VAATLPAGGAPSAGWLPARISYIVNQIMQRACATCVLYFLLGRCAPCLGAAPSCPCKRLGPRLLAVVQQQDWPLHCKWLTAVGMLNHVCVTGVLVASLIVPHHLLFPCALGVSCFAVALSVVTGRVSVWGRVCGDLVVE
jgi:hypothetical protein